MDHDLAISDGHVKSVEQWRAECFASQLRADHLRGEVQRQRKARKLRRDMALGVAIWLTIALIVAWKVFG
jgi:hypothetical protein